MSHVPLTCLKKTEKDHQNILDSPLCLHGLNTGVLPSPLAGMKAGDMMLEVQTGCASGGRTR